MSSEDYLKDISEIKNLMNKSSRFISLSGLAGIFTGFYALIGAGYAYWLVTSSTRGYLILDGKIFKIILIDLLLVLFFSVGTAIYLTTKRAKQNGERIWDATTKRLLVSFLVPLISGGLYIIIILSQGKYGHTGALMLLFYGLALINASKYTVSNVRYLGYTEIILGLIGAVFPGYGFWFWVIGFGVMHIIYGGIVYVKHERKQ